MVLYKIFVLIFSINASVVDNSQIARNVTRKGVVKDKWMHYSNKWQVQIVGDESVVREIAKNEGFSVEKEVKFYRSYIPFMELSRPSCGFSCYAWFIPNIVVYSEFPQINGLSGLYRLSHVNYPRKTKYENEYLTEKLRNYSQVMAIIISYKIRKFLI